jgi:hypothetical protein
MPKQSAVVEHHKIVDDYESEVDDVLDAIQDRYDDSMRHVIQDEAYPGEILVKRSLEAGLIRGLLNAVNQSPACRGRASLQRALTDVVPIQPKKGIKIQYLTILLDADCLSWIREHLDDVCEINDWSDDGLGRSRVASLKKLAGIQY